MNCRGREVREKLVEMYEIKPVAHVKLLNGQVKRSCTGDELIDNYYCFSYRVKGKPETQLKSFYCGSHASRHFLELLGLDPLPCFNPLEGVPTGGQTRGSGNQHNNGDNWNATMKELYNALNLLIVYWDISPKGAMLELKLKIEQYKYAEPFDSIVKAVNTIISKDSNGYKMQEIIDVMREGNTIKNYSFERVNERLVELDIESHF